MLYAFKSCCTSNQKFPLQSEKQPWPLKVEIPVPLTTKELSMQGIKEVSDVWDNMKFNVNKYMKGTQERGYILGAVDEVLQNLDDNSMNLQSMSASRFIGPFLNTVQTWEKSLSLIGEVLEVSLQDTGSSV